MIATFPTSFIYDIILNADTVEILKRDAGGACGTCYNYTCVIPSLLERETQVARHYINY
jgi:hypothetical protein